MKGLQDVNIFIAIVYIRYWYSCTFSVAAPMLDLKLIENLIDYRNINLKLANKMLTVFGRHLWYLSESLVGLAFFDRSIDAKTKRLMITALEKNGDANKFRHANINILTVTVADLNIESFITSRTLTFFESLFTKKPDEANHLDFLEIDPSRWEKNESYLRAEKVAKGMLVVNDAAERAVGLMTRFNEKLTNVETEKQMVLQVVEKHQKMFGYRTTTKEMLLNNNF